MPDEALIVMGDGADWLGGWGGWFWLLWRRLGGCGFCDRRGLQNKNEIKIHDNSPLHPKKTHV